MPSETLMFHVVDYPSSDFSYRVLVRIAPLYSFLFVFYWVSLRKDHTCH